ncbi:MAG TPA: ABC transporter permease, partial [Spirochaetia bacterium]|nr:ABC transporter permease [Spirochaetia bacterium]
MSNAASRTLTKKMLRVAAMEFRLTAANKAFVVITIIGPFLIVAMSILPSLLAMNGGATEPSRIALVGNESLQQAVAPAFAESAVDLVEISDDEEALRRALGSGDLDAYVVLPGETNADAPLRFVTAGGANFQLVGTVEAIIGQVIVARRLAEAGFDPARVRTLTDPPSMEVRRIDGEGDQGQDMMSVLFTALAFTFMLYMTVLLYGQSIGNSVLREKRSKTVEIMLSSLSPRELLVGKIAGKAGASLLQYAIWIGMAVLFLQVLGPVFDLEISLAGGPA